MGARIADVRSVLHETGCTGRMARATFGGEELVGGRAGGPAAVDFGGHEAAHEEDC